MFFGCAPFAENVSYACLVFFHWRAWEICPILRFFQLHCLPSAMERHGLRSQRQRARVRALPRTSARARHGLGAPLQPKDWENCALFALRHGTWGRGRAQCLLIKMPPSPFYLWLGSTKIQGSYWFEFGFRLFGYHYMRFWFKQVLRFYFCPFWGHVPLGCGKWTYFLQNLECQATESSLTKTEIANQSTSILIWNSTGIFNILFGHFLWLQQEV